MATTTSGILASSYSAMTNFTINSSYPITRAYTNTSSTTYTQINVSKRNSTGTFSFTGFDFSSIPANAIISSVTVKFKGMVSSTSYISAATVRAQKNGTNVGSATSFRSTSASTYTLSVGTWSRADLDNFSLYISATRGNTNNTSYVRIYGMDVSVVWDAPTEQLFYKENGTWTAASKVYKKVNGSWVQQTTLSGVFDPNTNYVKG